MIRFPDALDARVRTLTRANPGQLAARVRRMGLQRLVHRRPDVLRLVGPLNGGPYGPPARWPVAPRHAQRLGSDANQASDVLGGRIRLAGHDKAVGWPPDWRTEAPTTLWAYHLHYFDWVWALLDEGGAASREQVASLLGSWAEAHRPGVSPAWDPYPTALRAWNLCALDQQLDLSRSDARFARQIDTHYRLLTLTTEDDLGANHLIADLKALVGLAAWRADHAALTTHLRTLLRTLRGQILADGGHEERSPAYHAHVLADLLDVEELLAATSVPVPEGLTRCIGMMRYWLHAMRTPLGTLPFFNDGDVHRPEAVTGLLGEHDAPRPSVAHLAASGFVVLRPQSDVYLAIDVAGPGPATQPGHAHAGIGSFELWVGGQCVFRNTGSSTYAPGERRAFERSTAAQNTVMVGEQSQSQMWHTFRVGRTPDVRHVVRRTPHLVVEVQHDGFRTTAGGPIRHHREFRITAGELHIRDQLIGDGTASSRAHLHTPGDVEVSPDNCRVGPVSLGVDPARDTGGPLRIARESCRLACGFGELEDGARLVTQHDGTLPLQWTTSIRWSA